MKTMKLLMTEIYKIKNNHAPPIMHQVSQSRENTFNLRNIREIVTHNKKTSRKVEHRFFVRDCHLNIKTQHL